MRLSERVRRLQPSTTLAVTARVRELKNQGVDVIGFGVGEPDFDTPGHIKQAAIDSLLAGCTKYAPTPGEPAARRAVAAKLQRDNGIDCDADDITITTGGKHALYIVLQCLLDPPTNERPASEVILPTPAWVSYRPMIELAGGKVVEVPGALANDFRITPDQLQDAITDRTAALILNSPSNPTGMMYTPDELRALMAVVEQHPNLVVISDEMYEKLTLADIEPFSPGSMPAIADRVVTINGLSKAYAMTGWRIGYLCAPDRAGGRVLIKAITALQSQMTSNITSFTYAAVVEALERGEDDAATMRAAFVKRARLISSLIGEWPEVVCPRPTGAFYVFPDIGAYFGRTTPDGRRIDDACSFAAAMLEEARVAVVPGDDFGECAKRHVRLSFATSEQQITEGCTRIRDWLRTLQRR